MHSQTTSLLQVSGFDRTKSMLAALIFLCSFVCLVLFTIWFNNQTSHSRGQIIGGPAPDRTTEIEIEATELVAPDLPSAAPEFALAINSITDVVSKLKGSSELSLINGVPGSTGNSELGIIGKRKRAPAPPSDIVPESRRWQVKIQSPDDASYFRLLRAYEIEIGLVHQHLNSIIRIENKTGNWVCHNSSREKESQSRYFANTSKKSSRWDRSVATNQGLDLANRLIVHFYPTETITKMRALESARLAKDNREIADVTKTDFEIVKVDHRFEFRVKSVTYRNDD